MRSTLDTHQNAPHLFFDTRGRYWTASPAPGSARGAGAATEPPISVRRPGPERGRTGRRGRTAVDARGTSRTHAAESMRWGAGRTRKNRRTDTGGAARLEIAWHEPGVPGSYDRRTLGDAQQREREPDAVAPNPPSPVTPPGSQDRWARLALTPPIQMPRAATQQAQPEQPLPNQRQRWHRLRHRVASVTVTATCMRPVTPLPVATTVTDSLAVNMDGAAHRRPSRS